MDTHTTSRTINSVNSPGHKMDKPTQGHWTHVIQQAASIVRYALPVIAFLLPVVVTVWYWDNVHSIIADADWSKLKPVTQNSQPISVTARDLGGRMQFGIASTLLRIVAAASIILAGCVALRQPMPRPLLALLAISLAVAILAAVGYLAFGNIAYFYLANREGLIDSVLRQLQTIAPQSYAAVSATFHHNPIFAGGAGAVLLAAFVSLAIPAGADERTGAALRARMRGLEHITICSALLLVVMTAVNKTLIDWPQAFLTKPDQEAYAYLIGASSTFWGTFGTIFLVSAFLPAFIAVRWDIANAAKANGRREMAAARWKEDNKLEFDFKSGLGAAIAAAAPMLTAPGIDLASKLLH